MNVSIYSYNYAPEPIGIPFYNTAMATWLHRRLGWQVTVHTGMPHYPWWRVPAAYANRDYSHGRADEVMDGVTVERVRHYVPCPPVGSLARMRLDASWLVRVAWRSCFRRKRPHAIIVISPPFLAGLLGLLLRVRWRVPVIYHVQDLQIDAALKLGLLPPWMAGLLRGLEALILRRVDLVTTISPGMRRTVQAKARTRRCVALFPNWADAAAIRPWMTENSYRRAWGVGESEQVIMYSGNLGRKQGIDLLLTAAAQMRQPMHLVIAGDGAERAELEELAKSLRLTFVRFTDLVPHERLGEFLSAADVHCIPQKRVADGLVMPSKLLNIMAVARPVVVTCDPGSDLAASVRNAACGEVVAPESPAELAQALDRLLLDRDGARSKGGMGRAYVERALGIDAVLGRFAQQVAQLVHHSGLTRTGRT